MEELATGTLRRPTILPFSGEREKEHSDRPLRPLQRRVGRRLVRGYTRCMIHGAHVIIYSKDAEADRAFLRDVLKYQSVDAGRGWLIFALPPAEVAVHPSDQNDVHELFLRSEEHTSELQSLRH